MPLIDFGVQSQCNESSDAINKIWNELLEIFYDPKELDGYYSNAAWFQIVFRVSSGDSDFDGGEGPEHLKVKKNEHFSIDITIPEKKWRTLSNSEFRQYVIDHVVNAFNQLRKSAIKSGVVANPEKLDSDFDNCLNQLKKGQVNAYNKSVKQTV